MLLFLFLVECLGGAGGSSRCSQIPAISQVRYYCHIAMHTIYTLTHTRMHCSFNVYFVSAIGSTWPHLLCLYCSAFWRSSLSIPNISRGIMAPLCSAVMMWICWEFCMRWAQTLFSLQPFPIGLTLVRRLIKSLCFSRVCWVCCILCIVGTLLAFHAADTMNPSISLSVGGCRVALSLSAMRNFFERSNELSASTSASPLSLSSARRCTTSFSLQELQDLVELMQAFVVHR